MTEIIHLGKGEIVTLRNQIDELLDAIGEDQLRLATSYARLGRLLCEVSESEKWRDWGYESWGKYIQFVGNRIHRERSQIYASFTAAKNLLPLVSESDLETVGISKAIDLQKFVKQSGRNPAHVMIKISAEEKLALKFDADEISLLEFAKHPEVSGKRLHAAVLEALHEKGEVKGTWFDLGGFYATADEKKEILNAMSVARRVEPIIPDTDPEHVQRKAIFLRWAQEFAGTYSEELTVRFPDNS